MARSGTAPPPCGGSRRVKDKASRTTVTAAGRVALARRSLRCSACGLTAYPADERVGLAGFLSPQATRLACLASASWTFFQVEWEAATPLLPWIPRWAAIFIMPAGFALIAVRAVWQASKNWPGRAFAASGLIIPVVFAYLS